MVRRPQQVETLLEASAGRCGVGILVEAEDAVRVAAELGRLPLTRVYVGLNDLAIERGSANIFEAVADGTVERVRESFDVAVGFGGLTKPTLGSPVPCALLIAEMMRLGCTFSFLRRSFRRDVPTGEQGQAVKEIRAALARAGDRTSEQVAADSAGLARLLGFPGLNHQPVLL
jgi:hypothetical protein